MARLITLLGLLLVSPSLLAQEQMYEPSYDNPDGEELVLAFVSSTWCAGNRAPGLHDAIEEAKLTISNQASEEEIGFRAVGISLDWRTAEGFTYLSEFGEFDEVIVGSNWFNLGAEELIWKDEETTASIPQLIIFRREANSSPRPSFGERQVLDRVVGGESIVEWVEAESVLK